MTPLMEALNDPILGIYHSFYELHVKSAESAGLVTLVLFEQSLNELFYPFQSLSTFSDIPSCYKYWCSVIGVSILNQMQKLYPSYPDPTILSKADSDTLVSEFLNSFFLNSSPLFCKSSQEQKLSSFQYKKIKDRNNKSLSKSNPSREADNYKSHVKLMHKILFAKTIYLSLLNGVFYFFKFQF